MMDLIQTAIDVEELGDIDEISEKLGISYADVDLLKDIKTRLINQGGKMQ